LGGMRSNLVGETQKKKKLHLGLQDFPALLTSRKMRKPLDGC
jgi:hypothetical protein